MQIFFKMFSIHGWWNPQIQCQQMWTINYTVAENTVSRHPDPTTMALLPEHLEALSK